MFPSFHVNNVLSGAGHTALKSTTDNAEDVSAEAAHYKMRLGLAA